LCDLPEKDWRTKPSSTPATTSLIVVEARQLLANGDAGVNRTRMMSPRELAELPPCRSRCSPSRPSAPTGALPGGCALRRLVSW